MVRKNRFNRILMFILLLFPFIEPQMFYDYKTTTYIYYFLKLLACFFIVILYGRKFKLRDIDFCLYLVILFRMVSIIPTMSNPYGDMVRYIGISVFDIAFVMIMQWCCFVDKKLFLLTAIRILEFWILANAIMLFIPELRIEGTDTTGTISYATILGVDNRYIYYYLPFLFLRIIYVNEYKKNLSFSDYLWYFICLFTLAYTKSIAALLGILLFIPFIIYMRSEKKFRILNYNLMLAGILVLNILFVFFRIQNYFWYFIENILHKNLTLSFRTLIWDQVLAAIEKKPWLGYGYETARGVALHCHGGNHAHNYMLTLLLRGGFVGLIIYCCFLLYANVDLRKHRHDRNYKTFLFVMGVSLVLCIFDSFDYVSFYLILFAPAFIFSSKGSIKPYGGTIDT